MKTFKEADLITWSNRKDAVIGNEYYFGDSLDSVKNKIETRCTEKLIGIYDDAIVNPFESNVTFRYVCILPVDAVKETEPEKKYRACKNIREFYRFIIGDVFHLPTANMTNDSDYIYDLLDRFIHIRNKKTKKEYHSMITSIVKDGDTYKILIHGACHSLSALFNNFEIKINGEWRPFGMEVKE